MDNNDNLNTPYGALIQSCHRWLLSTWNVESVVGGETFQLTTPPPGSALSDTKSATDQIVGVSTRSVNICQACGYGTSRGNVLQVIDLAYPKDASGSGRCRTRIDVQILGETPFVEILQSSIVKDTTQRVECPSCRQFANLRSQRTLAGAITSSLPPVLTINAGSTSNTSKIWQNQGDEPYLPTQIVFSDGPDGSLVVSSAGEGLTYEVRAMVVQVQVPDSPGAPRDCCKDPSRG